MFKRWGAALAALVLAVGVFLTGCGAPEAQGFTGLTAEQAKAMMDEGNVVVVDVRTQDEYTAGHVPGAILVPGETIGSEPPAALPDLDATLLVYCRSGRRSREAAGKLAALGYTAVYDFGGIIDWPYDVVEGDAP